MRTIDVVKTKAVLVDFIRTTIHKANFSDAVIAVSGGVDSAVAASLVVGALGPQHVHALLLPYGNQQGESVEHAHLVLNRLTIPPKNQHEINIGSMVDSFFSLQAKSDQLTAIGKTRLGNIMARVRMIILFDWAKKLPALVIGTENKSEHFLGYYTRFGDEASDVEPLRSVYKTEVYKLAHHLQVPEKIINKAPSAGLWSGQTDEGQFGFTYKEADEILYGLYDQKLSEVELVKQGMNKEVITKVQKWVASVSFKHNLPHIAPEPAT